MNNKMIWYVSYGSNILFERFQFYILGGVYPGNGRYYEGCTNRQLPSKSQPVVIPYAMYFGNQSGSWGGSGVAFLDDKTPGFTLGRMYLITEDQFHEIQNQEGNYYSWYGKSVALGEHDGVPVRTFTSEIRHPDNPPSDGYLKTIRSGIQEMMNGLNQNVVVL
jgi:hypothetical protein